MKSKTIDILLCTLIIIILGAYFGIRGQVYSKQSLTEQLESTEQYIKEKKWDEAIDSSHKVQEKWDKAKFLIMVNYAEADVAAMEEYINLLVGGTEKKDEVTSLTSTMYVKDLWRNMKKFVPQP